MKKISSIRHKLCTKECMKKDCVIFEKKRHTHHDGINRYTLQHTNKFKKTD